MKGYYYVFDMWMRWRQEKSKKGQSQKEKITTPVEIKTAFENFPKAVVF